MTLRLYMDHHVPVAVTEGLRLRRVDVLTAYEDGTAQVEDSLLAGTEAARPVADLIELPSGTLAASGRV